MSTQTHTGTRAETLLMQVQDLTIAGGTRVVQTNLTFDVHRGEVLAIMGPSGCGKSTLLRHMVGLAQPLAGTITYLGADLHAGSEAEQAARRRRMGVMFQYGALWSSMSVGENVMLPMRLFTTGPAAERREHARAKLAQVGLPDHFDAFPASLSGGQKKRAALARALALEPELLLLDEPGSGLDPLGAAHLDELILTLRHDLNTGVVLVSHDIASILGIADRALYLSAETRTMTALAPPQELLQHGPEAVREFLRRGKAP